MQELKDIPDYKDVVDYMLKNKVKLEQEIVSLRLMSKLFKKSGKSKIEKEK